MTQRVVTHIQTNNLSKTYFGTPAVSRVSITIRSGRKLIIAGPNGGGKTTLLDCLAGMQLPDATDMLERPAVRSSSEHLLTRRSIGYAPDSDDTLDFLTGLEYCQLVAAAYRRPVITTTAAAQSYLQQLEFPVGASNSLIQTYSHGMRKKVQLAALFAVAPPVLIIDEPTNGLDPTAILLLKKLLATPQIARLALVIATHHLSFAESLHGDLLLLNQSPLAYGVGTELLKEHNVQNLESLYDQLVTVTV